MGNALADSGKKADVQNMIGMLEGLRESGPSYRKDMATEAIAVLHAKIGDFDEAIKNADLTDDVDTYCEIGKCLIREKREADIPDIVNKCVEIIRKQANKKDTSDDPDRTRNIFSAASDCGDLLEMLREGKNLSETQKVIAVSRSILPKLRNPNDGSEHFYLRHFRESLLESVLKTGEFQEAESLASGFQDEDSQESLAFCIVKLSEMGKVQEAKKMLATLQKKLDGETNAKKKEGLSLAIAMSHAALGDTKKAEEIIETLGKPEMKEVLAIFQIQSAIEKNNLSAAYAGLKPLHNNEFVIAALIKIARQAHDAK